MGEIYEGGLCQVRRETERQMRLIQDNNLNHSGAPKDINLSTGLLLISSDIGNALHAELAA